MDRQRAVHVKLGMVLRDLRLAAGFSQRQVAARLHRSHSFVGDVEHGERRLYIDELPSYARALGKEPAELIATIRRSLNLGRNK